MNDPGLIREARELSEEVRALSLPARTHLGRFELQAVIGAGGHGVVHRAYDPQLDRLVAIKVPTGLAPLDQERLSRIAREAKTVAALKHPQIVDVYEVIEVEGVPCIVSEYVAGRSMSELIRAGILSLDDSIELMKKIVDAIEYAHGCGVIHRDLKPANILIDEQGEPRITDFGLARRAGLDATLTVQGRLLGTPAYMSPEQCAGEEVKETSDIYSLGVILYELLTSQRPFAADSLRVFDAILHDPPPPPSTVKPSTPRPLEAIVLKCLAKSASDRYQTAKELASDLNAYLHRHPVSADSRSQWQSLKSTFEDTRHVGLLATYANVLMIEGVCLLIAGLSTAVMFHHYGITARAPFFAVWVSAILVFILFAWMSKTVKQSLRVIEQQFYPIWLTIPFIWWSILLFEVALGLDFLKLAPLLPLGWAILWAITARLITGKAYVQALAYLLCSVLMLLFPEVRMYTFAVMSSGISIVTGLIYRSSE